MANIFSVNVYQINQTVMDRDSPKKLGFPTTGVIIQDLSGSPTRSLPSGYNVYGLIIVPGTAGAVNQGGNYYYVAETYAQLVTLIG